MKPYVRRVPTGSGGTAVQIVWSRKRGHSDEIEHVGSAHDPVRLAGLWQEAERRLHMGQDQFDLGLAQPSRAGFRIVCSTSKLLWDALNMVWVQLGFAEVLPAREKVFPLLALARVVEPTSKRQTIRVLSELGVAAPSYDAITDCVWRCWERDYRTWIERALAQTARVGSMSFCLYDVTTLHWETDSPDELRKSGFSKQRRLEPQIVLGLLTGPDGFPLLIREFEGNKAETKTIIPVLNEFRAANPQVRITVIADAGMLSEANLSALETAGYDFIVGGRIGVEVPGIVRLWQIEHPGEAMADQQIFRIEDHGTKKNPHHWVQWFQYRHKRALRELHGIDKSVEKARKIATGEQPVKRSRFVTDDGTGQWRLNEELAASARDRAGIRSYKTNLVNASADQIIGWYHQLWHVEHTFRMAKTDLKARPAFHYRAERIHAHLTIVLAGLAVAKRIEQLTGMSILAFIHELKPIRHIKIDLGDELTIEADNDLTTKAKEALTAIQQNKMWD